MGGPRLVLEAELSLAFTQGANPEGISVGQWQPSSRKMLWVWAGRLDQGGGRGLARFW